MKQLLAKLSPRRAVGVHIGVGEIAVSQVVGTLFGPVEVYAHREPCQADDVGAALARVLTPLLGKRSGKRIVALSLPPLRVFFSTRPLKATNVEVSSKVLLHEALRSPNTNVEEMAIDMRQASPGKRHVVSLASCRKKYLTTLMADVQGCDVRPVRVEPAHCAILRAAEQQHPAPRRANVVLRVFLSDDEAMAVLCVNGWPVVTRSFRFGPEDLATSLITAARATETLGKLCGTDSALDALLIHGNPALRNATNVADLQEQLGARVLWHDGPPLDAGSIARGCAVGCLKPHDDAFDLARAMKPRETIWELFPWAETVLQAVAVVLVGLCLWNRSREVSTEYATVLAETAGRHWLSAKTDPQLLAERQELERRVEAIRKFLATRIVWTSYTQDIPSRMPANATLNSFQALCEMEKKGRKDDKALKPKKSFMLRIQAPISQTGAAPKEIDEFLDSLRGNDLLKRDFPLVELADIKWYQPFVGAKPTAFFTVMCLPKTTTPGAAASGK
jgi:hypothetical protein